MGSTPAADRTPFAVLSETGVVGVLCFVVLLGVLFLAAERMSGISKSFWLTVLGVWTVGACSLSWECLQPAWLLFGLLAAHSACVKREGITKLEREQKQNYYGGEAQVWS